MKNKIFKMTWPGKKVKIGTSEGVYIPSVFSRQLIKNKEYKFSVEEVEQ